MNINIKGKEVSEETAHLALAEYFAKHPEPKPELRHGDYGYDRCGESCLRIFNSNPDYKFTVASKAVVFGNDSGGIAVPKIILGNIFDDLERNKVDLEEFKIGYTDGSNPNAVCFSIQPVIEETHIQLIVQGSVFTENMATFTKLHQKLGQLIATALRKKRQRINQ